MDGSNAIQNDSPLGPLSGAWIKKLRIAEELKMRQYGRAAAECMMFYHQDHSFLWDSGNPRSLLHNMRDGVIDPPDFRMTYNIVAELVQLFAPALYHKNPNRQVNPRQPVEIPENFFVQDSLQLQLKQISRKADEMQQQLSQQLPPGPPGPDGQPTPNPMIQQMLGPIQQMAQGIQQQLQAQADSYEDFVARQMSRAAVDQTRAQLLERMLNYTPNELDLKTNCRMAVEEALIKGMSGLVTKLHQPPGADHAIVGTFWESSDNILLDPDAIHRTNCFWMSVRCIEPVWMVERKYNLKKGSLKPNLESLMRSGDAAIDDWAYKLARAKGNTNDLLCYYEIYSKMGMGNRLRGIGNDPFEDNPHISDKLKGMGDFCYIVIAEGHQGLINLPDSMIERGDEEEIANAVQWPTPFWADDDWPVTIVAFHEVPGQIYPMSHVTPAIGEIKFIDFCLSYMANKVKSSSTDLIGVIKAAEDDLRKDLTSPGSNGYKIVGIEAQYGTNVAQIVSFLQHPPWQGDIWRMLSEVMEIAAKRLGLTELAYGMSDRQYRSAAEANSKQNNFSIRPDDMANQVEDAMTLVARKEAIASRWHLQANDVAALLGPEAAMLWEKLVVSTDFQEVMREFEYRIEANSTRKPNHDRDAQNMQSAMQYMLPMYETYAQTTGNYDPLNKFVQMWAKASDMPANGIPQLSNPPPRQDPKQQEAEAKLAQIQAASQAKQQELQGKLQALAAESQIKTQQAAGEAQRAQDDHELERQRAMAEIQQQMVLNEMEMEQRRSDLEMSAIENAQKLRFAEANQKIKEQAAKKAANKPQAKAK